jgi:hypothetical protein
VDPWDEPTVELDAGRVDERPDAQEPREHEALEDEPRRDVPFEDEPRGDEPLEDEVDGEWLEDEPEPARAWRAPASTATRGWPGRRSGRGADLRRRVPLGVKVAVIGLIACVAITILLSLAARYGSGHAGAGRCGRWWGRRLWYGCGCGRRGRRDVRSAAAAGAGTVV